MVNSVLKARLQFQSVQYSIHFNHGFELHDKEKLPDANRNRIVKVVQKQALALLSRLNSKQQAYEYVCVSICVQVCVKKTH